MTDERSTRDALEERLPKRWPATVSRPGLSPRDRYLGSIMASVVTGQFRALSFLLQEAGDESLSATEKHEILLQAVLFAGYPKALTAFDVLSRIEGEDASPPKDPEATVDPANWPIRGHELFFAIYGKTAPAVLERLAGHHPALPDWILRDAYGRVLSRTGLSPQDRELAAVAALTVSRLPEQLYSHARGALRLGALSTAVSEMILQMALHVPQEWIREAKATCTKLLTSPK
ncbi:MAG: carboxymuconolactone decarboxylase family protein [Planctomycetota bacterium]